MTLCVGLQAWNRPGSSGNGFFPPYKLFSIRSPRANGSVGCLALRCVEFRNWPGPPGGVLSYNRFDAVVVERHRRSPYMRSATRAV
jgi:hypothetical protein